MAVVRNLIVRAGADFSGLRRQMAAAQKNVQDFKSRMNSALAGIGTAFAAVGIGSVIADSTRAAMAVEAAVQQINRTMGVSANAFVDWANETGRAFNMSKADALKYGAIYSNLLSTFSADTEDTKNKTVDLLKASAVVASGTGRTMEDVMWRIRSGLLGNTEAIEDLGINVYVNMLESTKAFRQFAGDKSWDQLDFQTQQLIRYYGIMEQANKKFGAEINQNTNSTLQRFTSVLGDIKLRLGQAFLPILNIVLPILTRMAERMLTIMSIVAQFSRALFGGREVQKSTKATTGQTGAVDELGDAYKKAGDKAKKAKAAVAGFDEVNELAEPASASGADEADAGMAGLDGGLGDMPEMGTATDLDAITEKVQAAADRVKAAFSTMSSFVTTHKDIIISALAGIGAGFATYLLATNWAAIIGGIRAAFVALRASIVATWAAISWPITIIVAAIALLVGAFVYFYRTNEGFRGVVDGILQKIGDVAKWLWENVLVPFGKFIGASFVAAWNALAAAAGWVWKNVMIPLSEFFMRFWRNVVEPLAKILGASLAWAFDKVGQVAKSFWTNVMVPLGNFLKATFGPAVEALSAVLGFLWKYVVVPFAKFLGEKLMDAWKKNVAVIQVMWGLLKPFAEWIWQTMEPIFNNAFKAIGEHIGKAQEVFVGILNFITDTFTGEWETSWQAVSAVFGRIWESLYGFAKTPLNKIIDMVNQLIDGLNTVSFSFPDWVPKIGGKSFGISLPRIPHLAKGGITNGEMTAVIGDNPGGREVVSPLSDLMGMIQSAVATAIMTSNQLNGGGNQQRLPDIVLNIDGQAFARVTNPYQARESVRIGGNMIKTT